MRIQCTKKLLDQLKIKPELQLEEEDPLFSWHANMVTINRKKTVILVNDKSRYVIALYGLKAKDFQNLDKLIPQAIRTTFLDEGIQEEIVEQYLQHAPSFTYSKTKDKTTVSRMNKSAEAVFAFDHQLNTETIFQPALSKRASRYLVGHGKKNYIQGNQELYKSLEEFAGGPIFQVPAVEVRVNMVLDKHQVWRRLVVPLNYTFYELHEVLQTAFDWDDAHLHEFYIFGENKDQKPVANIVCHEEALQFDKGIPMKLEQGTKLSSYLPMCKKIKYIYDFGDNWQHDIVVESVIDAYDHPYPICLEGEGTAPPEDIGGEGGYDYLLEVLADKTHPDHRDMVHITNWQSDFDIKKLNIYLKANFE